MPRPTIPTSSTPRATKRLIGTCEQTLQSTHAPFSDITEYSDPMLDADDMMIELNDELAGEQMQCAIRYDVLLRHRRDALRVEGHVAGAMR